MDAALKALKDIAERIGLGAYVLIVLSIVTITFAQSIKTGSRLLVFVEVLHILSGVLFAIGILMALFHNFSTLFQYRPARGMIDGLAAGALAGIFGGLFGFGFHRGSDYIDAWYLRTLLCVIFAVPIGGILGICVDLYHPERQVDWRRMTAIVVLGFVVALFAVALGLYVFVPEMKGKGIIVRDIQLIFEFAVVLLAIVIALSRNWSAKKIGLRLIFPVACIGIGRVVTGLVPVSSASGQRVTLGNFQMYSDEAVNLSVAVLGFIVWFMASYGAFALDHPVALWLERKFAIKRVPTSAAVVDVSLDGG